MAKSSKHELGFSLIESLIALALLSIAFLSIQVAILKSSKIARGVNDQIHIELKANNAVEDYWAQGAVKSNNDSAEIIDNHRNFKKIKFNNKGKYENHLGVSRVLTPKINKYDTDEE